MNERRTNEPHGSRWQLLRDVAVFQVKLLVDGLRDLLMSPASLIAVLVGLLTERERPDRHFRRLIDLGARSERWINLFGQQEPDGEPRIDELFERLDARIREEHDRGGMAATARERIDRALDALQAQIGGAAERARPAEDRSRTDDDADQSPPPPPPS